ncbi:MAG TPA: penicillin acylase family protein [Cyclobacteriaceae bacterium]|nr:penicillin acylase family protein [Cyclobacteriaceae bacterium]
MKTFKVILSFLITVSLVYALNRSWSGVPGVDSLPALGRFLDPFHGFWANAEDQPAIPETLSLPGLKGEVKVVYDSMLIPHIYATNDDDLYFAQGYITASFRLWQMETQIRGGAGRLSEVLGKRLLDYDRSQRRLGMVYAAENALQAMEGDPVMSKVLASYTAGVNAYIETLNAGNLPMEYKLLDYQPERWKNFNSAMLLKNMAQTLNIGEKDKEMTVALTMFGKPMIDLLWPDNEMPGDPIVDKTGQWKFNAIKFDSIPLVVPEGVAANRHTADDPGKDVGSNNWAVSGSKTATGSPILCNDPHLNLSLPSLWFAIHLNAPGVNTMGSSLPGAPGVIIGFNDSIAWGLTNAQRDLVDYYKLRFKDNSMNEYFSDGSWKATRKVVEKYDVKGQEPVYDTITFTHHGPVTKDNLYAFRWVSHDASNELRTFYELNRGKNHSDYMNALNSFSAPAQNFVFASVGGDIAMRIQGKYPVRRKDEGKFVLDGTKTSQEWQAFIPFDQNVMDKNPPTGFVSSANQYPVDATYPYYVTGSSFEAYRNRRINQVLSSLTKATVQDMMNLQLDNYNLKAAESLPYFLSNLDSTSFTEPEKKAWQVLKSWDYINNIESQAASYYEAWWDALLPLTWDEMDVDGNFIDFPTTFNTIRILKEQPTLSFLDIKSTSEVETARELLLKSFKLGVEAVEKWKLERKMDPAWADFKGTIIRHLLQLDPLSVRVKHGGNHDIVNATTRTHGPSWRMIVSLEKTGVKAWGVYPGGQSGNAGSKYFSNMIPLWGNGKYISLQFTGADNIPNALGTTTFKPEEK